MIVPSWPDHLLAIGGLLILLPPLGDWAYRRLKRRIAEGVPGALIGEYRFTLIFQLVLVAVTCTVWLGNGRTLAALGVAPPRPSPSQDVIEGVMGGAAIGLLLRPALLAVTDRMDRGTMRMLEPVRDLLPVTLPELAWGIAISLGAGVSEEIAYRGFLQAYAAVWLPFWGAIAAASIVFGLAHWYQDRAGILMTAAIGALLGTLYGLTGSLYLPILLHALLDVSAMLSAYLVLRRVRRTAAHA